MRTPPPIRMLHGRLYKRIAPEYTFISDAFRFEYAQPRSPGGGFFVISDSSTNSPTDDPKNNPKTHDSLFKWLIAAFTTEFFDHYFPSIPIGAYTFIDKEFISKYEALKESLKDDLFLIMEVEIEGAFHEVVIQIEHMSHRESVAERMFEYLCYA